MKTAEKVAQSERVTIAQIAHLAGVSTPTVSKVLNGRRGVSEATRTAVNALLEEHGYQRRGTLRRSRVGLVDLMIHGLGSQWASELVQGAEQEAARSGVGLVVSDVLARRVGTRHWLRQLAQRRTDGIVLVVSALLPSAQEELARLNLPVVLVDPAADASPLVPSVSATNWAGGLAATEHLIELGHRRIGIVTGDPHLSCSQDRLAGYYAALQRAGLPSDPSLVEEGDFLIAGGRRGAARLLSLPEPPTAIFAGSDHQAHGVYQEARQRGLDIPRDLSVVGFDDIELCEWITPTLTTVRQPLAEMASEATRMVLALGSATPEATGPRRELGTTLIVRESTAPVGG